MQPPESITPAVTSDPAKAERRALLMEKAKQLEAGFLAEMLSYAGVPVARAKNNTPRSCERHRPRPSWNTAESGWRKIFSNHW